MPHPKGRTSTRPKNFTTCLRYEQALYFNAHDLVLEACALYRRKSFSRAFALAVLAYEELGKLHFLDHINAESWGRPDQRQHQLDLFFSRKQGFNHVIKQRWALAETRRLPFATRYHDGLLDR